MRLNDWIDKQDGVDDVLAEDINEIARAVQENSKDIEGKDVFTTSEETHNEQGFYRVVNAEYPQNDKAYRPIYTMGDGVVLQGWEEIPNLESE